MENPNVEIARNEILIVLHYLLKMSDEKHIPKHEDIMTYALEKFHTDIRRQRVGPILEHLYQFSSDFPHAFPFQIGKKSTGTKAKYYMKKIVFDDEELHRVATGILLDHRTLAQDVETLLNLFLDNNTSIYKKEQLNEDIRSLEPTATKWSYHAMMNLKKMDRAKQNQALVYFWHVNPTLENVGEIKESEPIRAYVFDTLEFLDNIYAIMLDIDTNKVLPVPLGRMVVQKILDPLELETVGKPTNLKQKYLKKMDINLYLQQVLFPEKDNEILNVEFRYVETPYNKTIVYDSFKTTFNKQLEGKIVKVNVPYLADLMQNERLRTVNYFVTKVKVHKYAFLRWATQYEISQTIEVLGPYEIVHSLMLHHFKVLTKNLPHHQTPSDWTLKYDDDRID